MAVPSALARKRIAIEQAMAPAAPEAVDTSPDTIEVDMRQFTVEGEDPTPAPAAAAPPTLTVVNDEYEADVSFMADSVPRDTEGNAETRALAHQLAQRDTLINKLQEQLTALTTRLEQMAHQVAPVAPSARGKVALAQVPLAPLDERRKQQVAEVLPVVQHAAQEMINQMMAPVLERLALLEGSIGDVSKSVDTKVGGVQKKGFENTIRGSISDFDGIIATPEFRRFAGQRIKNSAETVNDQLRRAWDNADARTVITIIKDYKKSAKAPKSPETFSQPGTGTSAPPTPATPGAKPMLAFSKRKAAGDRARMGLISQAELAAISKIYEEAAYEGRVNYDA